jgi:hypothetical protein
VACVMRMAVVVVVVRLAVHFADGPSCPFRVRIASRAGAREDRAG